MNSFDSLIRMNSPLGRLEITARGSAIVGLNIARDGKLTHDGEPEKESPVLEKARTQLTEYFAGKRKKFSLATALDGTDFQKAVWSALVDIPHGAVLSYGEVGHETGRATAGRAVGGAVGANPIPIIIPCHRVLGSDGRITGYSGGNGIPTKVWLLDHEGIAHK
jgi:methylated-DNA-[protein]-cysteine S-methyltransferase